MEQRKERCEGARNVLVDPMHRASSRSHLDHLRDLASLRPSPRHRCHAAAPVVAAALSAGVSSPSCSACSLCLSYASSLRVAAGSGPDGVAVGSGHENVAVGSSHENVAVGSGHDNVAVGSGSDGVAVGCGSGGVATDSGGGVAVDAYAGFAHELKRKLQPVAAEHGDVVVVAVVVAVATAEAEVACVGSAPELERKLVLVAGGMPLT